MSKLFEHSKAPILQEIREVNIGNNHSTTIKIGKQKAMPFVRLDGPIPNKPKIAVEVHYTKPDKYPELLTSSWKEAINSPVSWANKAKEIGADLIALRITGTEDKNIPSGNIIDIAKNIIESTKLPLCILGINNRETDKYYLPEIATGLKGYNCLIGCIEEETYRDIIPACRDANHCIIARTPIDVNLAKQLNILITELGLNPDKIVMDPNIGALGYGLDYAYSVVEKIRLAAFEGDSMLNMPVIVFPGEEAWRTKEAKSNIKDDAWGDPIIRATMWEALTASSMLMVGADIIVMSYPSSIKHIKKLIKGLN